MNDLIDFQDLPKFRRLKKTGALAILHNCLHDLLNCDVKLQCKLSTYASKYDLFDRIERTTYIEDDMTVTLVSRIFDGKRLVSAFGVRLSGPTVALVPGKVLNAIANTLTRILSSLYIKQNSDAIMEIGERMLKGIIASSISKGYYDHFRIEFLIDYMLRVKSLSYEGSTLQTGLILTRSYFAFQGKNGEDRGGTLSTFDTCIDLIHDQDLNKRNWYLVDGKTSFLVFGSEFRSNSIYVLNREDVEHRDYLSRYLLKNTLSKRDVLLRVVNPNHFSIVTSSGVEFINLEGIWHVRNYELFVPKFKEILGMSDNSAATLIFFCIQLSQQCKSSIIFVPDVDEISYSGELASGGINVLGAVSFEEKKLTNSLFRIFSSDGVTIISKDGILLRHGAIVNLKIPTSSGSRLVGTGQVATQTLAKYGTAIKVSSDGTITILNKAKQISIKF